MQQFRSMLCHHVIRCTSAALALTGQNRARHEASTLLTTSRSSWSAPACRCQPPAARHRLQQIIGALPQHVAVPVQLVNGLLAACCPPDDRHRPLAAHHRPPRSSLPCHHDMEHIAKPLPVKAFY
jgi:hypothetical protein